MPDDERPSRYSNSQSFYIGRFTLTQRQKGTKLGRETYQPIPKRVDDLSAEVVDAAFQVHRTLGPGLLESVYQNCICHELSIRKIPFQTEVELPVIYKDVRLESGFRLDILVDDCLILELKSVENVLPLHEAQLLTYLKLTEKRLGILLNFNVVLMKDGIKRVVF